MNIVNIFSKRQKELNKSLPDCYQYDYMSDNLRIRLIYIVSDFLGSNKFLSDYNPIFEYIHEVLCREYGVRRLHGSGSTPKNINSCYLDLCNHLEVSSVDRCLDVFELLFEDIYEEENAVCYPEYGGKLSLPEAINVFNQRLKEESVGYRFENGLIFRIDSEFMHSEATKPALEIISKREEYKSALDEFIIAHDHYKKNRFCECIVSCSKSLESLLKSICHLNGWEVKGDTLQKLVAGAFEHGLIPSYLQDQFTEVRKMVSSGVGNIRNNTGAHGKGIDSNDAPAHLVQYLLNLTASNLLFLAECNETYMSDNS